MNYWKTLTLVSLGGGADMLLHMHDSSWHSVEVWGSLFVVSLIGWVYTNFTRLITSVRLQIQAWLTGRPILAPETDPKALAAEITRLNVQVAQLRDTATSFDVSFDTTLQRLDERLRRIEQQTSYIEIHRTH